MLKAFRATAFFLYNALIVCALILIAEYATRAYVSETRGRGREQASILFDRWSAFRISPNFNRTGVHHDAQGFRRDQDVCGGEAGKYHADFPDRRVGRLRRGVCVSGNYYADPDQQPRDRRLLPGAAVERGAAFQSLGGDQRRGERIHFEPGSGADSLRATSLPARYGDPARRGE